MERRKLTKEDIDKVRHIEGFPIGSDEDIIALSDAPFYTACPNPFIEDFIREHGKPYDEATDDYHREPYTADVTEDKHDLIYNIHGYHTKVPPKAIQRFIEHYTDPGDLVLDAFCGSGMTGIAAQLCQNQRSAIISDLSPYATFIAANYNTPNEENTITELEKIIDDIEKEYGKYYLTMHTADGSSRKTVDGKEIFGKINYVVWSCVYFCPHCGEEMVYHDILNKYNMKSTQKTFHCPKCNLMLHRSSLETKHAHYVDKELSTAIDTILRVPTLINYTIGKKRHNKRPDKEDLQLLSELDEEYIHHYPRQEIIRGVKTEELLRAGINHVKQLYPRRALILLSTIWNMCRTDNKKLFLLTSAMPKMTMLNRFMPEHGSRALVGPLAGTYYLPPLYVENDVIGQLRFQLRKLQNLHYTKGNVLVTTQAATDLSNIPDNSIDYIFVDPPFGANIMYSELNYPPESWLGVRTNNTDEAIVNKAQRKDIHEYKNLMTKCFMQLYRILKPRRWMTIEFHNSKNIVWNAIQEALNLAGFVMADIRTLNKEKKTINQFNAQGSVDQDLIISAYKPKQSFERDFAAAEPKSPETAWAFVTQHLSNLPVVVVRNGKVELINERQGFLLFDRMVAYHLMHGLAVPIDASEFYAGLDERFIKRDEMYFLPDQINEYDTARLENEMETIEHELFVTNEKSAIAWLYAQMKQEPQTYQTIQPKFMKEIVAIDRREKLPELAVLLSDNFIQDDAGRWYIPDRTKEGDVAKLREKNLLREFDGYLATNGKLKQVRIEAIKAGFARLWADHNFRAIVDIARRLPEDLIQEDDKLLMFYDVSLGRTEG